MPRQLGLGGLLGLSPVVERGLGRFVPPNGDDNPFAWLTAQQSILARVAAVSSQPLKFPPPQLLVPVPWRPGSSPTLPVARHTSR